MWRVVFIFLAWSCQLAAFDHTDTSELENVEEKVVFRPTAPNEVVKLKCHDMAKKAAFDDTFWEFKKCGDGLSLTSCEELSNDSLWQPALCRNKTKLCTGTALPIFNPQERDSGLYRCLQKYYMSSEYRVNRVIRFEVQDPKSNTLELLTENPEWENKVARENDTVVFRCRVRSVRMPYFGWIRRIDDADIADVRMNPLNNLYEIKNFSTHKGENKVYTSKMHIANARLNDSGYYFCFAIDGTRQEVKKVSLLVLPVYSLEGASDTSTEILWIVLALLVSVMCCALVLCFLTRRQPKRIPISTL